MNHEIVSDMQERTGKAYDSYENSLTSIRTGRANSSLVEQINVEHYGQKMPLNQLATLGTPEAQLITIQPWDSSALEPIMKALQASELGITPQNDGTLIRLPIPPLTEERRLEMVKQLHKKTEDARISMRNSRRTCIDTIKQTLKKGELSEDEAHQLENEIEKITQNQIEKLEQLGRQKEQELLVV
ncbi:MAG: ribosome recycling factor [Chloroflexi bacterium]|nr:ribosome recycling factor [Chloroflexota bacterium]|tara:strand:+ start:103 stop:660 length:558 start_codon:yes stop_codon:yes gene_type:complete